VTASNPADPEPSVASQPGPTELQPDPEPNLAAQSLISAMQHPQHALAVSDPELEKELERHPEYLELKKHLQELDQRLLLENEGLPPGAPQLMQLEADRANLRDRLERLRLELALRLHDPLLHEELPGQAGPLDANVHELAVREGQTDALARKIMELGPGTPERTQLEDELRKAVASAFESRQHVQRLQIAMLERRLQQARQRMDERARLKASIIERRVKQLVSGKDALLPVRPPRPARDFDTGIPAAEAPTTPRPSPVEVPRTFTQPPQANQYYYSTQNPLQAPQIIAPSRGGLTTAPIQQLLDPLLTAQSQAAGAQADLAAAQAAYDPLVAQRDRVRQLHKSGVVSEEELIRVDQDLRLAEAKIAAAKNAVETARRAAELALAASQTQLQLLETEYEQAEVALDLARKEAAREKAIFESTGRQTEY
jgi:hypothetical protein